jgi:hypothetical protein
LSSLNQFTLLFASQLREPVQLASAARLIVFGSGAGWRYADEKLTIPDDTKRLQGGVIVKLTTTCCGLWKTVPLPTEFWAVNVNLPVYVPGNKLRLVTETWVVVALWGATINGEEAALSHGASADTCQYIACPPELVTVIC